MESCILVLNPESNASDFRLRALKQGPVTKYPPTRGKPRYLLIALLFVSMLSGRFALSRIDVDFERLGLVNHVMYWFLIPFFAVVLIQILYEGKFPVLGRRLRIWVIMVVSLLCYMALTGFWAPNYTLALERVPELLSLAGIIIAAPFVFARSTEQSIEFFLKLFLLASLAFAAGALLKSTWWDPSGRMAAFLGGANVFVRVVGTGAIIATYLWAKTSRFAWLVLVPILTGFAIMSGSRGGLLALFISFALLLIILSRKPLKLFAMVIVVSIVSLGLLSIPSVRNPVVDFWRSRYIEQSFVEYYGVKGRLFLIMESWEMYIRRPIMGVGLDGFQQFTITQEPYPHNLVLHLAAEGGIIALILFGLACALVVFMRFDLKSLEHIAALVLAMLYFVASMFSGGFYDTRFMWLFLLLYMMAFRKPEARHKPKQRHRMTHFGN